MKTLKLSKKVNRFSQACENGKLLKEYLFRSYGDAITSFKIPNSASSINDEASFFIFECNQFYYKLYFKSLANNENIIKELKSFNEVKCELIENLYKADKILHKLKKRIRVPFEHKLSTSQEYLVFELNFKNYIKKFNSTSKSNKEIDINNYLNGLRYNIKKLKMFNGRNGRNRCNNCKFNLDLKNISIIIKIK